MSSDSLNIASHVVQQAMNLAGRTGKPFLFGLDFEMTKGFFLENPLEQSEVLFRFHGISNAPQASGVPPSQAVLSKHPLLYKEYKSQFDLVAQGLRRGDSFLTNLTVRTPIDLDWSLEDVFFYSKAPFCLLFPNQFVCFSPERFVLIEQGQISTNPMKGTIDALLPNAADRILNDAKETAEHYTVVDLLRNDLSKVADQVRVNRFRYLERIATCQGDLLQVSSEIVGSLSAGYLHYLGDLIFSMLPAGSVSGAPKEATMRLIALAEQRTRGYYTGVCGYFDGVTLDSAVMIRFIELQGSQLYFASGGGITAQSVAEEEYAEIIQKVYLPF